MTRSYTAFGPISSKNVPLEIQSSKPWSRKHWADPLQSGLVGGPGSHLKANEGAINSLRPLFLLMSCEEQYKGAAGGCELAPLLA